MGMSMSMGMGMGMGIDMGMDIGMGMGMVMGMGMGMSMGMSMRMSLSPLIYIIYIGVNYNEGGASLCLFFCLLHRDFFLLPCVSHAACLLACLHACLVHAAADV